MAGKRIMTIGPKKTKAKRPPVNGFSPTGTSTKVMTHMSGKTGFGYQGAMMSTRGR